MTNHLTFSSFAARLREFIDRHSPTGSSSSKSPDSTGFNELALSLFTLQFVHNPFYRQFCQSRNITPHSIQNWRDIPALPVAAFKEFELTGIPADQRIRVFHSSGATGQRPSRHFHNVESLVCYETSLLPWFQKHLLPDAGRPSLVALTPPSSEAPHSSLVHMLETIACKFAPQSSTFTGRTQSDGVWSIDLEKTVAQLRESASANRPLMLLGTAFNFVHLLDHLAQNSQSFSLPPGSRALETGGYKGRSRSLPQSELHALITGLLGIPASHIVCEYGMSELSSQAYDSIAGNASQSERLFQFPPWARALVVSPETGGEVREAETGLIRIFDLANVYSVMALQTEDLGARRGNGFELLGRATPAEPRGCSLLSL